jgi:hypothetical protein
LGSNRGGGPIRKTAPAKEKPAKSAICGLFDVVEVRRLKLLTPYMRRAEEFDQLRPGQSEMIDRDENS